MYKYDDESLPAISVSASRDAEGIVHVSVANIHAAEAKSVSIALLIHN